MALLDNIPALPTMEISSAEMIVCPWCNYFDEEGFLDWEDIGRCGNCGKVFKFLFKDGNTIVKGVRPKGDQRYMEAMGVTEAMVSDHHSHD